MGFFDTLSRHFIPVSLNPKKALSPKALVEDLKDKLPGGEDDPYHGPEGLLPFNKEKETYWGKTGTVYDDRPVWAQNQEALGQSFQQGGVVASGSRWQGAPSGIHGNGAFASEPIGSNEMVDYLVRGLQAGGLLGGNRTSLGDLINHQSNPNSRMEVVPSTTDQYYLRSLSDIDPGTELTMDYNDTPDFVAKPHEIDPDNYMSWG